MRFIIFIFISQKSRRWCIIDFENQEKLTEAKTALKQIKVQNKKIKVYPYLKGPLKKGKVEGKINTALSEETTTNSLKKLLKKD